MSGPSSHSSSSNPLQQLRSRGVEPRNITRLNAGMNVFGEYLAQLHTPLVKAVDAPYRTAHKHAVFLQCNQGAQIERR